VISFILESMGIGEESAAEGILFGEHIHLSYKLGVRFVGLLVDNQTRACFFIKNKFHWLFPACFAFEQQLTKVFCKCHCGVVARRQHQSIEQIMNCHSLIFH